jgi:predicted transcriptional regulator
MAMTVRLPEDIDARLTELAARRHTSKHALLIEAADRFVTDTSRAQQVDAAIDFVLENDAELLERLEDA